MTEMAASLPCLPIDDEVWSTAYGLARSARAQGHTVPATDLIIAACARRHGIKLEHDASHLEAIQTLQ